MNDKEHFWCIKASERGGGFVRHFAKACLYADKNNFEYVCMVLMIMMKKYPEYLEEYRGENT